MNKKILVLSAIALSLLVSCNNGGGGGSSSNVVLSKINISDASSLFIGNAKNTNDSSNDTKKLFKITENGYVEEVTFTWIDEETGEEVQQKYERTPQYVKKLDDTYVFVCFNNWPTNPDDKWNTNYFVNTKTNECYKYPNTSVPKNDSYSSYSLKHKGTIYPSDRNGNIYVDSNCYVESGNSHYEVKKINIEDPTNVTLSNASLTTDSLNYESNYAVDKNGNCYYQAEDAGGVTQYRVFKSTGGYSNLNDDGVHSFWTGYDGYVYDIKEKEGYPQKHCIIKLNEDGSSIEVSNDHEENVNLYAGLKFYLNEAKQVFAIDGYSADYANSLVHLYDGRKSDKDKFPLEFISLKDDLDLKTCRYIDCSSNYIYLLGTNNDGVSVVVVMNPLDYSSVSYPMEGYDLYSLTIGTDDTFTFNATRQSDNAIIVGTITYDAMGKPHIHESSVTFSDKVESLIHL